MKFIKKTIGIILLLHPLLISYLFIKLNLDFFWYFYDDFKVYDFFIDLFSFCLFVSSFYLLSDKKHLTLIIFIFTIFVVYQSLSSSFNSNVYRSKLVLNDDRILYLVPSGGGATTEGLMKFVSTRKYKILFIKHKVIKSYKKAVSGVLHLKNNNVVSIQLTTDNKIQLVDEFNLEDISF